MRIKEIVEKPIEFTDEKICDYLKINRGSDDILNKIREQINKQLDSKEILKQAIKNVEENGIVFLDEVDKICSGRAIGSYASSEGFQRDLLPLIEGTTILTKHGPLKTDNILFIASCCKLNNISDMFAEFISKLPIRVEIDELKQEDYKDILTKPKFNLIYLQQELFKKEGITLSFDESAINSISEYAFKINSEHENIGARVLHSILEKVLNDISYEYSDIDKSITIYKANVEEKLKGSNHEPKNFNTVS